jgi:exodeoxyribonuclease V alpha subunit
MLDPQPGQGVVVRGRWQTDRRYGEQFRVETCRTALPASVTGIRNYLQSGMIKGVGATYADRIVDHFGADTVEVLENDPERLLEVEGIGRKRLKGIVAAWREHQDIRDLMLFLQSHDVSSAYAVRIFKFYGRRAMDVVRENPYRLAMDIPGVGFLTADRIADKLGFGQDCELRAEAGAMYVLHQMADQGHVYAPMGDLMERCAGMLQMEEALVERAVQALEEEGRVVREEPPGRGPCVYLTAMHVAEKGIAQWMERLMATPKSVRPMDPDKAVQWVSSRLRITPASGQAKAMAKAVESKVLVVTGGPGTGKTTIISAILRLYDEAGSRTLLAAPTGRAAKRMAETTGHEAMTIHRLLEYSPQEGGFCRDQDNPLSCSLLVVDEASMIDVPLMYHLLKAVPPGATLILVGDVNQLPSVGPGKVLQEIIASEAVPVVELTEIFRQARESSIVCNAHAINAGALPDLRNDPSGKSDFYFMAEEDPDAVLELVVDLVHRRLPRRFGFDPVDDIQVLTPMHKGTVGAANLNTRLQEALNPQGVELARAGRTFRLHDKVMQIRNNYDKDVFNGDIGRIVDLDPENRSLAVDFDGRRVVLEATELEEIVPAYAISIHKSQGSEYTAVVIPILTQHYILLQRNLLYTAVTRGKQLVVLVGSKKALAIAVNNSTTQQRHTALASRLAG